MMPAMTPSPPGWYSVPGGVRWWDGAQWVGRIEPAAPRRKPLEAWAVVLLVLLGLMAVAAVVTVLMDGPEALL